MASTNVETFAAELKVPADVLLEQLKAAGVDKSSAGDPLSEAERAAVFAEARNLLGVPWRHKGRTERGVDCLGLLWLPLSRVRPVVRPADDYGRLPHNKRLRAELTAWLGEPVPLDRADVVTMRWGPKGEEHHVGYVVSHPFHPRGLIECASSECGGGRVVEHGIDAMWQARLIEGWAL